MRSDEARREIKILNEKLAGLKRAEIHLNTMEAMERKESTINTLVSFTHNEGLVITLKRDYRTLAVLFGDIKDSVEGFANAIEEYRSIEYPQIAHCTVHGLCVTR